MDDVIGRDTFWYPTLNHPNGCFAWDDNRIRQECAAGTKREWAAYVAAGHVSIPISRVAQASRNLMAEFRKKKISGEFISCHDVLLAVCQKHDLPVRMVTGQRRNREFIVARKEYCRVCILVLEKSLSQTARVLGNRDHTTIRHHVT